MPRSNPTPLALLGLLASLLSAPAAHAAADLIVTSITPIPATFAVGTPVRFDVTVKNQGITSTAADWLGVLIHSANAYATWGGKNATLAAGASPPPSPSAPPCASM